MKRDDEDVSVAESDDQSSGPAPQPEVRRLHALVGLWASSGETVAGPDEPAVRISGTDSYAWLGGGFFLVHRVDVHVGPDRVEVLEVIGEYDPTTQTWAARSFDNAGNVETMRVAAPSDRVFTLTGDTARSTLEVAEDGRTMAARWERADDGASWRHWMDMRFVRRR